LVLAQRATATPSLEQEARTFLARQDLSHAASQLRQDELHAIGRTLRTPGRRLTDQNMARLLRNPAAWQKHNNARELLGTIIKSLPTVATVKGIDHTVYLAGNNNHANFRGYGVEVLGAAALNGFVTQDGRQAKVLRMGAMVKGTDGRRRESDGAAVLGADGTPRLVSIKSVSTLNAVSGAMHKAAEQLALRNYHRDGSRTPGVILVGYDSPEVFERLTQKDWQAAADRSGAKLLVLGINQRTGDATKLASLTPDPHSSITAKHPGPRPPLLRRLDRFMMSRIGRLSPPTARRIGKLRSALKRQTHRLGRTIRRQTQRFTARIKSTWRALRHGARGAR
jgi:hypothetical protein